AIESTTGALSCDTSSIQGLCLGQCNTGSCINGASIAACMSACIGAYCATQTFVPNERCPYSSYWPEPKIPVPASKDGCDSDLWFSCESRCDACVVPDAAGGCKAVCHAKWCP